MYKTGKFYVKLAVPDGIAFPTHTSIEVGSLFHKNDEGLLYIYSGEWRPIPVYTGTPSIGDAIRWNGEYWIPSGISASGGGGVVSAFLDLTDVPDTYVGSGGYTVTVKDDETGLEFSAGGALSGTFISLTDTPANYSSYSGYLVIVNDDEDLLIFSTNVPGHDHTGDAGDGGQLDHGAALTGLTDDDHIQYLLATAQREGATNVVQKFQNGIGADTVGEYSVDTGVTVDDVEIKDGGITTTDAGKFMPGSGTPGLSYRANHFVGSDAGEADQVEDHFLAYPATGFAWAGAPFVTPGSAEILPASLLRVGTLGGTGNRAFYYKTSPSTGAKYARVAATTGNINRAYGLRMDDGSDNNYVEYVFRRLTTYPETHQMEIRSRVGGGAIGTTAGPTISFPPSTLILRFEMSGTRWSSWGCAARAVGPLNEVIQIGTGPSGLTYTPTRVGIIYDQGPTSYSTWERFFVDFVENLT